MLFNSYQFMMFLPVVLIVFYVIPSKIRPAFMLVASYYFYMGWNAEYAILIGISTFLTWISAIKMEGKERKTKRYILIVCLVVNLLILFFFKYCNFGISIVNALLSAVHIKTVPRLNVLLPVGISFYTFQALGYIIDVYRGTVIAEKNLVRYALFVSYFPQLVAGPIERSGNLLEQLNRIATCKRRELVSSREMVSGVLVALYGFFLKMVVADRVAILVEEVFSKYWGYSSFELVIAAIGFSIQIYCDFASYSLIAMGVSKLFGIKLMENFAAPYFSKNIQEFWRRWHISLSSWFRDYVYIPLGGKNNRNKNLIITFLISGLWHGASFNYVVWGGIHGVYQIVGEKIRPIKQRMLRVFNIKDECFSYKLGQILLTYCLTTIAWIFFRAEDLYSAIEYIVRIFTRWQGWKIFDGTIYNLGLDRGEMNILVFGIGIMLAVDGVRYFKNQMIDEFLLEQNTWFRWIIILVFFLTIFIYGAYGPNVTPQEFIYFQF